MNHATTPASFNADAAKQPNTAYRTARRLTGRTTRTTVAMENMDIVMILDSCYSSVAIRGTPSDDRSVEILASVLIAGMLLDEFIESRLTIFR